MRPAPEAAAEGGAAEGRNVRVYGRGVTTLSMEIAANVGDELHARLKQDFGAEPAEDQQPLVLTLIGSRKGFDQAVGRTARAKAEKTMKHAIGGWTDWDTCRSIVLTQAEDFDTRRLVIHELVHQFHARLRPASLRGKAASWYREGLAEWYGWHRLQTGGGVDFGRFDVLTRNDTIRRIQARLATPKGRKPWQPHRNAFGEVPSSYAESLALVAALRATTNPILRERMRAFEQSTLTRAGSAAAFRKAFTGQGQAIDEAVRAFWATVRPPLEVEGGGWDESGDGILLTPPGTEIRASFPGRPAAWKQIEVEVELRGAYVGLLFSASDPVPSQRPSGETMRDSHVGITLVHQGKRGHLQVARRRQPGGTPHPRGNAEGVSDEWIAEDRFPLRRRCTLRVQATDQGIEITVLGGTKGVITLVDAPEATKNPAVWLSTPRLIARAHEREGWARILRLEKDGRVLFPRPSKTK